MLQEMYSVDQVAAQLGLHVRTVRSYVRDGRLKAVRIGKQYRIAREDLEALTGHPVAGTSGSAAPPLTTQTKTLANGALQLEIAGPGWTDLLVRAATRQEFFVPTSSKPDAKAKFTSRLACVRTTSEGVSSFLALDATAIDLPGFAFHSKQACDLSARKNADGKWEVTASRDLGIALPATALQKSP